MGRGMENKEHKIAVIGGFGNMGRRYCSILRFLGVDHYIIDLKTDRMIQPNTTGLIVASPTDSHYGVINEFSGFSLPILCEKPLAKNREEFNTILNYPGQLRMINQYEYWFKSKQYTHNSKKSGHTFYGYYNSGGDGINWDCINIIGLSNSDSVNLSNEYPIWECWINGVRIPREEMDEAYIWNIEDWLNNYDSNRFYTIHAHNRVWDREGIL